MARNPTAKTIAAIATASTRLLAGVHGMARYSANFCGLSGTISSFVQAFHKTQYQLAQRILSPRPELILTLTMVSVQRSAPDE